MNKDIVKRILSENREELRTQFNVESLRLFGSVVRGEATDSSDIDFLVEFSDTPTLFTFLRLRGYLMPLSYWVVPLQWLMRYPNLSLTSHRYHDKVPTAYYWT